MVSAINEDRIFFIITSLSIFGRKTTDFWFDKIKNAISLLQKLTGLECC
jgi:hypothetical protein